jgi:HD-GYP domain-containing protein (c-di-GMP phosphodiesterase class II)
MDAHLNLMHKNRRFSGIFLNSKITDLAGIAMIRAAILKHPSTPLFLIRDSGEESHTQELLSTPSHLSYLPISGVVSKPFNYRDIQKLVAPILNSFDVESALRLSQEETKNLITETFADYTPVLIHNFISGKKSFFDLYIKIGNTRFLTIVKSGDPFNPGQLSKLIQRGVTQFYIKKEAQAAYLNYCDQLATHLVKSKTAPQKLQLSQTLNLGQETVTFLYQRGVSSEYFQHARSFLSHLHTTVGRIDIENSPELHLFLTDLVAYEHGVATSTIASLFIRALGIESTRLQSMIGMSALVHDIGLYQIPINIRPEMTEESALTPKQLAIYQAHPAIGAALLAASGKFEEPVIQAVQQHHLRRDGTGFPGTAEPDRISRIAEIIGISDDLVHVMKSGDTTEASLEKFWALAKNRFSIQILEACQEIFQTGR